MQIVRDILAARGLEEPDRRPLYALKVTDAEYRELRIALRDDIDARDQITSSAARAFVLFASEHLSRGDGSDWWSWDGVRAALTLRLPDEDLRNATRAGLRYWRRDVQPSSRGYEYLATLVCEGGLPLALLREEGARLRIYFSELLRQHETYPSLELRPLAARQAGVLPTRMRNEIVYELATKLIEHVAQIRRDGRASADPPLRLDDRASVELLNGLRTAPRVSVREEAGITVRTSLQRIPALLLRRRVALPPLVTEAWVCAAIERTTPLPSRIYFSVQSADGGRQTIGVGTRGEGGFTTREFPARDILREAVVAEQIRCLVTDGEAELGAFVPRGGEALNAEPWVFDDESPSGQLRATGTWRTRADSMVVLLPASGLATIEGASTRLGTLRDRSALLLRGTLDWHEGAERVRITTAAEADDDTREFRLRGQSPPPLVREADMWTGAPSIVEVTKDGVVRAIPRDETVWRQPGGAWSNDSAGRLGLMDVGVRRSAVLQFRTRIRVLPRDLKLSFRDLSARGGILEVRTASAQDVNASPSLAYTRTQTRTSNGIDIELRRVEGTPPPASVEICLRARTGDEVAFTVPFPAERVAFVDARGEPLPPSTPISLDSLAHVRAVVLSPKAATWSLDIWRDGVGRQLCVLREVSPGVWEAPLEPMRAEMSAALAERANLDDQLELWIIREGDVRPLARCLLRRYDTRLEPVAVHGQRCVQLDAESRGRLDPAIVESLRAESVPLHRPGDSGVELPRLEPGVWSLETPDAVPGPQLILAFQGDYLRARPLRVQSTSIVPMDVAANAIDRAVAVASPAERSLALVEALEQLSCDTAAPGWETVRGQLGALARLHPTTFDLVRCVTRVPRAAVLSLLDAGTGGATVWNAFEELPFLWVTVPLAAWLDTIEGWLAALDAKLRPHGLDVRQIAANGTPTIFGGTPLAPFLSCVHEAAFYRRSANVPEPARHVISAPPVRTVYRAIAKQERDALLARHANSRWPMFRPWTDLRLGPELEEFEAFTIGQPEWRVPALNAPLLLAQRVVDDGPTDLFALRQLRDFDPAWFDLAFMSALSEILGRRYDKKGWPFNER